MFNREGDCLAVKLRPGNVHSAEQWEEVLLPAVRSTESPRRADSKGIEGDLGREYVTVSD